MAVKVIIHGKKLCIDNYTKIFKNEIQQEYK